MNRANSRRTRLGALVCAGLGASTLGACAAPDHIRSHGERVSVIDEYERAYTWADPTTCAVFLHQRVTDQDARIVEYLARVEQTELSVLYWMDADQPLPMRIEALRDDGSAALTIAFDAERLEARTGDGTSIVTVDGYAADVGTTTIDLGGAEAGRELLTAVGCGLPLRRELGAVAPFLSNRDQPGRLPDAPDVSQGSAEDNRILDWQSEVSIPGSLLLIAACLQPDGWACPCLRWDDPITGPVTGWC